MVNLLIVRHAKTAWNKSGKIQGRSDVPLAPESEDEARKVGRELSGEKIDAVFCSPLSRAVRTAELMTEGRGLTVRPDDRLAERDFGTFEGKTYDELALDDHTKLFYALADVEGVEPSESVFNRVRAFLAELAAEYEGCTVLIVSHGVCISYLIYALTHNEWTESEYSMNYIKNLTVSRYSLGRFE